MLQRPATLRATERRKLNALEVKCLKCLVRVTRIDRVMNEEVRKRSGMEMEMASRVLRWFRHMERIKENPMGTMVLMAE